MCGSLGAVADTPSKKKSRCFSDFIQRIQQSQHGCHRGEVGLLRSNWVVCGVPLVSAGLHHTQGRSWDLTSFLSALFLHTPIRVVLRLTLPCGWSETPSVQVPTLSSKFNLFVVTFDMGGWWFCACVCCVLCVEVSSASV